MLQLFPQQEPRRLWRRGMLTTSDAGLAGAVDGAAGARDQAQILPRLHRHQFPPGCHSGSGLARKFRYLDSWTAGRQRNAEIYREILAGTQVRFRRLRRCRIRPVTSTINSPSGARIGTGCRPTEAAGRWQRRYYPLPLHLQKCFDYLGYKEGDFPVSEKLAKESLAVPTYSELSRSDIEQVRSLIQSYYGARKTP